MRSAMKYQEVTNIVEHGQAGKERRAKNAILMNKWDGTEDIAL